MSPPVNTKQDTPRARASISPAWTTNYTQYDPFSATRHGFNNPQSLCYRNSALVTYLHTPALLNWFQYHSLHHDCGQKLRCPLFAFQNLIVSYWFGNNPQHEICLDHFWNILLETTWNPAVRKIDIYHDHQDVLEFMEAFIALFYDHLSLDEHTELDCIFKTTTNKYYACKNCSHTEPLSQDTCTFLTGRFPSGAPNQTTTIEDAIIEGFQDSTISDGSRKCPRCKDGSLSLRDRIKDLPEILFVQINRQDLFGEKLKYPIFYEEELIIPDQIRGHDLNDVGKIWYELYAINLHVGDEITKGHYTCAVKGPNGKWTRLDDNRKLEELTFSQLQSYKHSEESYIFAYRRLPLQGDFKVGVKELASTPAVCDMNPVDSNPSDSQSLQPDSQNSQPDFQASQSDSDSSQSDGGVRLEEIIELDGRNIDWTVNHDLHLDKGILLSQFKPRTKTQRANIRLVLTSKETGEILEGEGYISLKLRGTQTKPRAKTPTVAKTPSSTNPNTASGKEVKPRGITKRAPKKARTKKTISPSPPYVQPGVRRSNRNRTKK
ncbi:hypothetical protein ASPWEDRAFT_177376 [Aspergillus wentii DTO 134E9]|uniref:USP domain-containing protein n=1 Tax=Aspergillus wentii DTO 134E9 TaxID=1073089 RepID=A0A1L9R725_ASPWE|nr:uncharacterized protein ASPWEDRAFT_177376 [Aspergillus wentii DTO 134E9]OJJ30725.1 hypothetical protein ASPWEDRAFT_177376 [Aspergillus wentii DTO 134E9]